MSGLEDGSRRGGSGTVLSGVQFGWSSRAWLLMVPVVLQVTVVACELQFESTESELVSGGPFPLYYSTSDTMASDRRDATLLLKKHGPQIGMADYD